MKRLLVLLILLLALPAYAQQCSEDNPCPEVARLTPALVGGGVPAEEAPAGCSGTDWTGGNTESFEQGVGDWCTDEWSETDANNQWTQYDTAQYRDGTHSAKCLMANTGNMWAVLDTSDAIGKLTFSVYVNTMNDYSSVVFPKVYDTADNSVLLFYIRRNSDVSGYEMYLMGITNGISTKLIIPNADVPGWFDVEIFISANNNTCKLRVWDVTDAEYLGDVVTVNSYASNNISYFGWLGANAGSNAFYLDKVIWNGSATDM